MDIYDKLWASVKKKMHVILKLSGKSKKNDHSRLDERIKSISRPLMATYPKGTLLERLVLLNRFPDALAKETVRTLVPECPLKSLVEGFAIKSLVT